MDAAHAPRRHRNGEVLGRDPRILPPVSRFQRIHRRPAARDGRNIGRRSGLVLPAVALSPRLPGGFGRVEVQPRVEEDPDRPGADPDPARPTGCPWRSPLPSPARPRQSSASSVTAKSQKFEIPADKEPSSVELDPNVWVLMDSQIHTHTTTRRNSADLTIRMESLAKHRSEATVYLGRQPIYGANREIRAYELLYRRAAGDTSARFHDGDRASAEVMLKCLPRNRPAYRLPPRGRYSSITPATCSRWTRSFPPTAASSRSWRMSPPIRKPWPRSAA